MWQPDGRLRTVTYYIDGDSGAKSLLDYTYKAKVFTKSLLDLSGESLPVVIS